MNKHNALFAGSFNLMHKGHLNVLEKASPLFKTIFLVITKNWNKPENENYQLRLKHAVKLTKHITNIKFLINTTELTTTLARKLNISYLIRGLRTAKDFEFEKQLGFANKKLNDNLITIFFVSDYELNSISSSLQGEIDLIKTNE